MKRASKRVIPKFVIPKLWLAMFAVFFAITGAYAFATPLGAGSDEPAHMVWAAATSSGQFDPARSVIHYPGVTPKGMVDHWLVAEPKAPKALAVLQSEECFQRGETTTGACGHLDGSGKLVPAVTYVEQYNPVYYAIVGFPIHFASGVAGMYLMRLVSAALVAALLAGAAALAWRFGKLPFAGVICAASPMAFILGGIVNPNGIEAAGGLLAWSALAALALDRRGEHARTRLIGLAVGSGVFAMVRPAGLEWLALFAGVAVLLLRPRYTRELLHRTDARMSLAALGALAVLAEAWNRLYGGLNVIPVSHTHTYTLADSLIDTAQSTPNYLLGLIGIAGGAGVADAPVGTIALWCAALGLLTLLALALSTRHQALALVTTGAGILLIPFAANAVKAAQVGNMWQGRYLLWWAVGLPVLAAAIISTHAHRLPATLVRRLPVIVIGACALGNLGMYWRLIQRYGAGTNTLFLSHLTWSPPSGWAVPALALLAAVAVLITLSLPTPARKPTDPPLETAYPGENAVLVGS